MTRKAPDFFQPWDRSKLPADAANPMDFERVRIWRDGVVSEVNPAEIIDTDDLYWQPLDAATARSNLN